MTIILIVVFLEDRAEIVSLGGIEAIISAMSTHKDHAKVQEEACSALGYLVANDGMFSLFFSQFRLFSSAFLSSHVLCFLTYRLTYA